MENFDFAKPDDFDFSAVSRPVTYFNGLNDLQREAVETTEGPLIVLAGAGSGKTKMLTSRIAHLIDGKGVPAHQVLAVTFTNKAATEMRHRVEKILDIGPSQAYGSHFSFDSPNIGTFHSICVRILRQETMHTPFTRPFVIYDDSDQLSLIKEVVGKIGLDDKAFSPKALQAAVNRAKCDAKAPEDIEPAPHNVFEKKMKQVYEQYQKDLFSNNALDFGEIICMTYRLMRDNLEVRAKYQKRFRYIHVDEYQDTNRGQYLLLATLAGKESGGHQNICVVGDEDQSIYKWRGADIRNILDFEKDYPGAHVVKLEQNYRSTKTIVTAASQVIRNNRERKEKTLWTENETGLPITHVQVVDERAEAEMVISEIRRLAENEGYSYDDFAIFYRTHAQSRPFEDVLRRDKIAYQIVGGLRFYDRKEIKDILSYLKIILNPADSISLKRIINVPGRGIGKTTIDKVDELSLQMQMQGEADSTFWAALQRAASDSSLTSAATSKKLAAFVAMMRKFMDQQTKLSLSELYHLILDETAYVRELKAEGTDEAQARIDNLEELDNLFQEFEEDQAANLSKPDLLPLFIEQAALASEVNKEVEDISSVTMMTLHSAKGLEFNVGFLVGMEEGLFPSIRPWEETPDEDIEEERRICYVGMTRARQRLYLSNAAVRRIWGNVNYQEPSRFFAEIPENLVELRDLSYGSGASKFRTGSSRQFGYGGGSGGGDGYTNSSARAVPSVSSSSASKGDLDGAIIDHPEYGTGTVIAVEGVGGDQKVVIDFKKLGRKKFLLRYVQQYLEK